MIPTIDMQRTGTRIKELRKRKGMPVAELTENLGLCCNNSVYKWQSGQALPTLDNLVILGALFGVSIDEIIVIRKVEERNG